MDTLIERTSSRVRAGGTPEARVLALVQARRVAQRDRPRASLVRECVLAGFAVVLVTLSVLRFHKTIE